MSERRQAAWDEAQRRYPMTGAGIYRRAGFASGAAWADDNPYVTPEALVQAYEDGLRDAVSKGLASVRVTRREFEQAYEARFLPDPMLALNALGFLRDFGIEVVDDE